MYTGERSYKDAIADIFTCHSCGLSQLRTNIVVYRGNPRSDVMVIGEGPGEKEDLQGKPMVGPTGSYLVEILDRNGLTLKDIYITNTILCREPQNADPSQDHIRACYPNIMKQIQLVNPKYILAVGKHAAQLLIPNAKPITQIAGMSFTPPHLGGIVVIPIPHPSYIMRARSLTEQYERLVAKICEQIKSKEAF